MKLEPVLRLKLEVSYDFNANCLDIEIFLGEDNPEEDEVGSGDDEDLDYGEEEKDSRVPS